MKPEFTADGVSAQTFDEIFDDLVTAYKAVYGSDIDLAQNTPDGQKVGIEAEIDHDLQSFGVALYNSFDPDISQGDRLERTIKLCGITRKPATKSIVDLTITVSRDITLAAGFIAGDSTDQEWTTTEENTLTTGANTITVYAVTWGKVEAPAGTITNQVTVIPGVTAVTNPLAAVAGVDEETDPELRLRRNRSLENASYSTVGGIYAKLANIFGVTDVKIYENKTRVYDATLDLNGNTLWCIVNGGSVALIAETIAKNLTAGADMKGSEASTYSEALLRSDGTTFYYEHEINFDRPTPIDLYIALTVTRKDPLVAVDVALIKEKLEAVLFRIYEPAQSNAFYGPVYQAGSNFIATALEISLDDITYTDGELSPGYDEYFVISAANITITEI